MTTDSKMTSSLATANQAEGGEQLRQLSRMNRRQLRLVVSLPALMFLATLFLVAILRWKVLDSANEIRDPVQKGQITYLADVVMWIGAVGALAISAAALVFALQIVRPLRNLIESMRNVAAGDLHSKTMFRRVDEIGDLGMTFNTMVEHLNDLFEQRDRQMRESAAGTIITLDSEGKVIAADTSVSRILGVSPDNLLERNLAKALREQTAEENNEFSMCVEDSLGNAAVGKSGFGSCEYYLEGSEKSVFYSLHVTPLESAGNSKESYLLDIRDLTGMREFHDQMHRADRLAALGTLAAGIAHEIRNPLASMRAMTQLLSEDIVRDGEEGVANEYLPRIITEIDRLERLVSGIMDFANEKKGPIYPVNLNSLLRYTHGSIVPKYDSAPEIIDVQWNLSDEMPECPIEEERLTQALLNIVTNAMECLTENGGGKLLLESYVEEGSDRPLVLLIANTSPPVPEEVRRKIFEPFFTTKSSGTGLGLPIAYQVITANCGLIEFDYQDGMATFIIRFPREGRYAKVSRGTSSISPKLVLKDED